MAPDRDVTLFYSPHTRSAGSLMLLEEMGRPYALHVLNMKAGEQRQPAYLAVHPMGKVPAVKHGDAVITEQVAVFLYLADLFPEAGLAPALDDPQRGTYLRWMVFYASCFEPAVVDLSTKREPAPPSRSPYGTYDQVIDAITDQLRKGPYILGDRFSAADILWGMALSWTTGFKLVPERPEIMDYVKRISAPPAFAKVREMDAKFAAEHEAAVAASNG